jgi:hypothetical protein
MPANFEQWVSDDADGLGLRALLALTDLELHALTLVERFVAVRLNGRPVDEDVSPTTIHGDESVAFLGVEPLDRALSHDLLLLLLIFIGFGQLLAASRVSRSSLRLRGAGSTMSNARASSVAQERTLLIELFDRPTR